MQQDDYFTHDAYLEAYQESETYDNYHTLIENTGLDHEMADILWEELNCKYAQ